LVTNGVIGVFDDSYEHRVEAVHLGENLYVKVEDGDADVSAERDSIKVVLTTSTGDRFVADLTETLTHSGVFSRAIPIERNVKPDPQNDKLEADFDAGITLAYEDAQNVDSPAAVTRKAEVKVVIGSDGVVLGFGKKYPDDDTAVETQFRIGECYYYLGRRHMELAEEEKRPETKKELEDLAARELAEGQRILQELVRVYPDSKKADQAQYLLASLAQEQKRYDEAIDVYREIVNRWPDSPLAPDAQYKVGMCFEKKGDFDSACEEYVRLAYQYPDSVLIGDAMIRIGLFFFNDKKYPLAIGVFKKFTERHPLHKSIEDVWFKLGMAFVLNEEFGKGAEHLERFVEKFPETKLKPASLYWAGDSYFKSGNKLKAYQMFKRVVWDFPESKWAKWARGQLTNPAFENVE
jgi:TolA-binding protein